MWERASQRLGPALAGVHWVRVGNAGDDLYEPRVTCVAQGHGSVIRAVQDRVLAGPAGRSQVGRWYATARAQLALGQFELALRARAGQPVRTASLSLSAVVRGRTLR
jgi:hypothetical protein